MSEKAVCRALQKERQDRIGERAHYVLLRMDECKKKNKALKLLEDWKDKVIEDWEDVNPPWLYDALRSCPLNAELAEVTGSLMEPFLLQALNNFFALLACETEEVLVFAECRKWEEAEAFVFSSFLLYELCYEGKKELVRSVRKDFMEGFLDIIGQTADRLSERLEDTVSARSVCELWDKLKALYQNEIKRNKWKMTF